MTVLVCCFNLFTNCGQVPNAMHDCHRDDKIAPCCAIAMNLSNHKDNGGEADFVSVSLSQAAQDEFKVIPERNRKI